MVELERGVVNCLGARMGLATIGVAERGVPKELTRRNECEEEEGVIVEVVLEDGGPVSEGRWRKAEESGSSAAADKSGVEDGITTAWGCS